MHHPLLPGAGTATTNHPSHQHHQPQHHNHLHSNTNSHHQHQPQHNQHNQSIAMGFMRLGHHSENVHDLPLRILVQSDMVGAIIGRSGSTIRQITQQTRARIDVHREDSLDQQDKVITINGPAENCSEACFRIIQIILSEKAQQQANQNHSSTTSGNNQSSAKKPGDSCVQPDPNPEIQLKMLAHNNLIGRLIGRKGVSIKEIMEQTATRINVASNSLTGSTNEHTVTILGRLEDVRQAEILVSGKLRASYVADISSTMQTMNQQPYLFNNAPISYMPRPYSQSSILSSLASSQGGHTGATLPRNISAGTHQTHIPGLMYPAPPSYIPFHPNMSVPSHGHVISSYGHTVPGQELEKETVNIYIPNGMVGAIIGKSGAAIKEMISSSGASIKVAAASSSPITETTTNSSAAHVDLTEKEDNQSTQNTSDSEAANSTNAQEGKPDVSCGQPQTKPGHQARSNVSSPRQTAPFNRHQTNPDSQQAAIRKVTIVGTPDSQCAAQYLIYRKVCSENGKSDITLMVEIEVPQQYVGKIIGKGGSTVKQLQMQTRTTIRLPDDKPNSEFESGAPKAYVQITGEFQGSQIAQRHIRSLTRENPYSNTRQSTKTRFQNKPSDNNEDKFNAQRVSNEMNQGRSDNGTGATGSDDKSEESQEKNQNIEEPSHREIDYIPASTESPTQSSMVDCPYEKKSQDSTQKGLPKINGDTAEDSSNNNTIK